jgi:hypothetical protein
MTAHEKIEAPEVSQRLDEIRRLALQLAVKAGVGVPEFHTQARRSPGPYGYAPLAQQAYFARRTRDRFFDSELFGEPAWDMLLDLFVQMNSGRTVSITSACIASCVPPTTALRWITMLVERGLVTRTTDPSDARRAFIELSQPTLLKFNKYFETIDNSTLKL